jgi:hypothetical protein
MIEMAGTFEQLTADTIWAPFLMMAECSALVPTIKPVTLCRKMMGVFLVIVNFACRSLEEDLMLTIGYIVG